MLARAQQFAGPRCSRSARATSKPSFVAARARMRSLGRAMRKHQLCPLPRPTRPRS